MLLTIPEDQLSKKVAKIVQKINEHYEKGKWDKIERLIPELIKELKQSPDSANTILYILSIIAETNPASLPLELKATLLPYLKSGNLKEKLNAIISFGTIIIQQVENDIMPDFNDLSLLFQFLVDPHIEIRQNANMFLESIPEAFSTQLLVYYRTFLDSLEIETDLSMLKILTRICAQIQPKMPLSALYEYISRLSQIFNETNPEKADFILSLMEQEIPVLKDRKIKRWAKKDIEKIIATRPPLTRLTDLTVLAESENLSLSDAENSLQSLFDYDTEYIFSYTEKNHKKVLEIEKDALLNVLSKGKIQTGELFQLFQHIGLTDESIVAVFLKDMLAKRLIEGYFKAPYFYSFQYIKGELLTRLQRDGMIILANFTAYLPEDIVFRLMTELLDTNTITGVYNKQKTEFYTFTTITRELEGIVSKSVIVDMNTYQQRFEHENFLRIEEYCRTHFLTPYRSQHIWLTNLGLTRIQQILRTSEQIGEFDMVTTSSDLKIPLEIIRAVTKEVFTQRNGFWNKDQTKFYYGKTVKRRITTIQSEMDPKKREVMIIALSEELQIDPAEITQKVDEKLQKIGTILLEKEEFEINPMLRDLQMEYPEFIKFVDSLEKPYLIINGKVIFAQKRINEERIRLQKAILAEGTQQPILDINVIANLHKCAKKLILEIIQTAQTHEKLKGIWINEEQQFLTEKGIIQRMKDAGGFIDLRTIIPEISPTQEQVDFLEGILSELLTKKVILGFYDPENKIYQSNEIAGEVNLQTERDRFTSEITPYLNELEAAYNLLKEILALPDISPQNMEEYERILEEHIRKILNFEGFIKRSLSNANNRLNTALGREGMRSPKTKRRKPALGKEKEKEESISQRIELEKDEYIMTLLNDFNNWKAMLLAIEQNAAAIVFLKKKLKSNPGDEESQKKLTQIQEILGFLD